MGQPLRRSDAGLDPGGGVASTWSIPAGIVSGPQYLVFAQETQNSRARTIEYGANYPKVSQAIWTAIQAAITGTASVSSALQTAQGTVSGVSKTRS